MRILAIANIVPLRDRSAGWFRFYHILRILSHEHEVHLHPLDLDWQLQYYGEEETKRYTCELENIGVRVTTGKWSNLGDLIHSPPVDLAFFEHYTSARDIIDRIRFWQPRAHIVIETIDVVYQRLYAKPKITNKEEDLRVAQNVKTTGLSAYPMSDSVVAIPRVEAALLEKANRKLRIEVIPLIIETPTPQRKGPQVPHTLVYVTDFSHDANVDGILHFCSHAIPLIQRKQSWSRSGSRSVVCSSSVRSRTSPMSF